MRIIEKDCIFIDKMNEKARNIGMLNSTFKNPSGLTAKGQLSTSYDLSLLTLQASANDYIIKIWKKKQHTIKVKGENERIIKIKSTLYNEELEQFYNILGGKTGTIGFIKNLTFLVYKESKIYVVTLLKAKGNRFVQAKNIINSLDNRNTENIHTHAYSIIEYPTYNPELISKFKPKSIISKNETARNNPASITKLLTILTAFEYPINCNDLVKIETADITEDNMNDIKENDIFYIIDLLHLMLLSSSNIASNALARYVTEKYL